MRTRRERDAERDGGDGDAGEGLDERGEAPPPYKPDEEEEGAPRYTGAAAAAAAAGVGTGVGAEGEQGGGGQDAPSVPLATLSRGSVGLGERGLKPPEYHEVVVERTEDGGPSRGSVHRRESDPRPD